MFKVLQNEILTRIFTIKEFFAATGNPASSATVRPVSKGLIFVQLYSVYEYTVTGVVRASLTEINSHSTPINTIRLELLGIALDAELASVIDSQRTNKWESKMTLFRRVNASDILKISDHLFPNDGSHFRIQQLNTIWELFGITVPVVPHPRFATLIAELVDNRNAISHGRRTAEDVGRSYTESEIERKINDTQDLCIHIVTAMQGHCSSLPNLCR
jgi:hypothetical protein